jgi:glycosyltransferase involved in cell wall biosynthesis
MTDHHQEHFGRKAPRVTVLMTYYGKREFVEEAVASVLASTFRDFDLLVVDDASTDGGLELIRAFADPRIRILESSVNTGRAAAANRGFDAALGEYVAILDADDAMHPERLARQVAFLDEHPEVGVLGTYAEIMGRSGAIISAFGATDRECRGRLLLGDPLWYGSAMFRRAVLDEGGLRCDPTWRLPGMDHLLLVRTALLTKVANLTECLTYYRVGEQNMRHGRDPQGDRMALYQRVFQLFGIEVTTAEVRLHIMLQGLFENKVDAGDVQALRSWLDHLQAMNRERGLFPVPEFEQALEERWRHLFFTFADHGFSAGVAHLRCSGSYPLSRLYYLFKVSFARTSS